MYLAIIILPLLGSIVSGFFGRKTGVQGSHLVSCTAVITTTGLSLLTFSEVGFNNEPSYFEVFRWIDSESLNVSWAFHFDSLTVSMLIPVLIVSSLVHVYSIGYMSEDPHNQRFFSYLSLFTFMMVILVTANNYLLMFVGWEGVGVCSYLLVCFWYTRIAANQSALAAFLTNRVGDCFLTIGMFAMLITFGNLDYATIFSLAPFINENLITIIGICLLIGAMAKSSQVGLHVWLPMAMEGPTPVSALIHAATMVTAGVYLLMRSSPLIEYSSTVLMLCLLLGAITTVFSSLIGLFQQDIKKVIAYSTMSQLGMMVIAVGLSCYNIALFHLMNHAFYKALLFLGAGSVIHAVSDNQDFRKYGGLRPFLPLTYSVMFIASLSLVAFPFMTGFYSKDLILESAYGQYYFSSTTVYIIATIGAMFTTLYSVKVLYLTFLTNPNGPLINYKQAHEGNMFMSLPLMILAVFSIYFGFIAKDIFIGMGSGFFSDNSIFIHPSHEILLDTEFGVPTLFKLLPLILTVLLTVFSTVISEYLGYLLIYFKFSRVGYTIFSFFNQRFLIELFYNKFVTGVVLKLGGQTTKVLDKGSVEYLGPYGLEKGLLNISTSIAKLNTGVITSYALYILVGLISYILISFYYNNIVILLTVLVLVSLISNKSKYQVYKGVLLQSTSPLGGSNKRKRITDDEEPGNSSDTKKVKQDENPDLKEGEPSGDSAPMGPLPGDSAPMGSPSGDTHNDPAAPVSPPSDTDNDPAAPVSPPDSNPEQYGDGYNTDDIRKELHEKQWDKYENPRMWDIAVKGDRDIPLTQEEQDLWDDADEDIDGEDGHLEGVSTRSLNEAKAFSKWIIDNDGKLYLLPILGVNLLDIPFLGMVIRTIALYVSFSINTEMVFLITVFLEPLLQALKVLKYGKLVFKIGSYIYKNSYSVILYLGLFIYTILIVLLYTI